MKKPPIGTPPREASKRRLAEEQAKRKATDRDLLEALRAVERERDALAELADDDKDVIVITLQERDAARTELATLRDAREKAMGYLAEASAQVESGTEVDRLIDHAMQALLFGKGES